MKRKKTAKAAPSKTWPNNVPTATTSPRKTHKDRAGLRSIMGKVSTSSSQETVVFRLRIVRFLGRHEAVALDLEAGGAQERPCDFDCTRKVDRHPEAERGE